MVVKLWVMLWILCMTSSAAQACEVMVQAAWARLPPPVSDTAAVYMTLINHCQQRKTLISVTSPQAAMTMMHHANMQMMKAVMLKPNQVFRFKAKSAHVMLMGLKSSIHMGEAVPLILHWQDGYAQVLHVEVKDMRGK